MSEEKKTAVTEEVKEEARELTEEELEKVSGGALAPAFAEMEVIAKRVVAPL